MRPLALLLVLPAVALAQPKDRPSPLDKIDGYKRHTVEGFTLMVSDAVANADVKGFDRKPMAVLELELKMVVKIMTAKQVDALRKLPVWVEWDEQEKMQNGRDGSALAVYYGGHQAALLKEGKQPLKAKAVTVLRMKGLTQEHQPKTDSGRCVLLHEFAHAVHDQLLGFDHAGIKAAYAQAMERKLYDKNQYVSTNDAEFFAETTCAYFDQLHHFPKTRSELKAHDPATHKLLEGIWGKEHKGEAVAEGKGRGGLANTGADQFDLTVKHADVRFGDPLLGPAFKPEELKGKVAVVGFFNPDDYPVLTKLADLHRELSPYGLTVVAGTGQVIPADKLKADLADRDLPFPTVASLMLRDRDDRDRFTGRKASHTLVFDAGGACVFRGSGHDAAPHARAAVGRRVVSQAVPGDTPKSLKPITDALVSGQPPLDVLPKLYPLALVPDPTIAGPAKEVLVTLTRPGQQALDEAAKLRKADPLAAFVLLEGHAGKYKGTVVGEKVTDTLASLKLESAVAAELKARSALEPIRKLDNRILAQEGGFDPTDSKFQQTNAKSIAELKAAVEQMRKKHPKAKATEQAEAIVRKYGK
jgi:hypothetical protein